MIRLAIAAGILLVFGMVAVTVIAMMKDYFAKKKEKLEEKDDQKSKQLNN